MDAKWMELSVEKLVPADWNYKEDDPVKAEKLKNNLKRNGQIENIIVRELDSGFYEVVNGNHRLTTFKDLGYDVAMVYNVGKISTPAAQRIAVETNETQFTPDSLKLAKVIAEIREAYPLEEIEKTMPYSEQELTDMAALLEYDFEQASNKKDQKEGSRVHGEARGKVVIAVQKERFQEFTEELKPILDKYVRAIEVKYGTTES